jgi:dihydropteroate synthase
MGVVNVTPDSFSDGGEFLDPSVAVAHGTALAAQGADLVDVGGESTRPGAQRVTADEELRRVLPVVQGLSRAGVVVSVDTMRAEVAEAAIHEGASLVNDVSGGLADPAMAKLIAATGVPFVAMHWRGHSDRMQELAVYDDVVADVAAELRAALERLRAEGVDEEQVILDPGLGFAKTAEHNWTLLRGLGPLQELGLPLLVGASRKSFLGSLLAGPDGVARGVEQREHASSALHVLLAQAGVWGLRVHDVRAAHDALRALARWERTPPTPSNEPLT